MSAASLNPRAASFVLVFLAVAVAVLGVFMWWVIDPTHKRRDRMDRICPICHQERAQSTVYQDDCTYTRDGQPGYDEHGHDLNVGHTTCMAHCTRGHRLFMKDFEAFHLIMPKPNTFEFQHVTKGQCYSWANDTDGYQPHKCKAQEKVINWSPRATGQHYISDVFWDGVPMEVN